jgi:hypothetical protein
MKLLSWNCRGAGRAPTVRSLKALVRAEGSDVFFVAETKSKSPRIEKLKNSLGFAHCFCFDSAGSAGGLALFWKMGVDLEVIFANKNVVVSLVYSDPSDSVWMLISVHGPPYLAKRKKFWALMDEIISEFSGLWLLIGDLNSTMSSFEKSGGKQNGEVSSRYFRDFVSNVGAIDLGFCGPKFTWSNRRAGWANIRERLDRGLCNADWQQLFPKAGVKHLTAPNSDHNPILLDTHQEVSKGSRPFRFEAMWTKEDSSSEVVERAWSLQVEGSHNYSLVKKCQKVRDEFTVWNRTCFGIIKNRIKEIEDKIKMLQDMAPTKENLELEASLNIELNDWMEREELKWK